MTTWFVSDLHLGHKLVSEKRGYIDVADHDAAVMTSLDQVTWDDVLWILGDVTCTGNRDRLLELLAVLEKHPARKHLVTGNHDPVHPMHRESHKWQSIYQSVFDSVQAFARVRVRGTDQNVPKRNILLSHFPYSGDSLDSDRYAQYRLPDLGLPLVHGHTHSSERLSRSPKGTLQINVCWEAWRRPVRYEEIVELLDVE
jgi:calcineurin-like phosphoesterase family protein